MWFAGGPPQSLTRLWFHRFRRWSVSKLPVSNFSTGMRNVRARAERDDGQKQGREREWTCGLGPFRRCENCQRRNQRESVKNINQLVRATRVFLQPCLAVLVRHRLDAIFRCFAIMSDRPGGSGAGKDKN